MNRIIRACAQLSEPACIASFLSAAGALDDFDDQLARRETRLESQSAPSPPRITQRGIVMASSFPSPEELKGAVQGTLLYLTLYLGIFIQFQSYSKFYLVAQKKREARGKEGNEKVSFREIKYYNSRDVLALTGDRTVGNFLEYSILFLPCLWMHALFVDPTQSFRICALYVFFRSYYPIVYQMKPPLLLLSTVPGYIIILYLMYQLTFKFALVD
jgi:hypothetical protein